MDKLEKPWHWLLLSFIYSAGFGTLLFHFWHSTSSSKLKSVECEPTGTIHSIDVIAGQKPSPVSTTLCDALVLINRGNTSILPTWGNGLRHYEYPGFKPYLLRAGEETRLILTVPGRWQLHDDFSESVLLEVETTN